MAQRRRSVLPRKRSSKPGVVKDKGPRSFAGDGAPAARALAPPVPDRPDFAVVGVGASAGGLEAFTALLRAIPADTPIAMVLVQHLARDHQSLLPELLRNSAHLAVEQARDGTRIEPGHVYVIPPDTRMAITDGHLEVRPRPAEAAVDAPVDHFLRSLATHYREKAIGVILSGGAHDGAAGIREIKAAGGITFAQDPREAAIDGMPRAAIATGAVDLVLNIPEIAAELVRLAGDARVVTDAPEVLPEGDGRADHLRQLFYLLRRVSGVDFTHYKSPTVMRRIQRRMALHRLDDLHQYVGMLQRSPKEAESLYEDLLIHVTSFFREADSFAALKETVFPQIIEGHGVDAPIRLWVPGCSSGEEVYSLAIALLEYLGDRAEYVPVQIFGTDVSQKMVERARAGVYSESVMADVSAERLRRFFVKIDGSYRINKNIRERCVFARQDITRDPPFSKLSLVVCRNLLIYLGQPLQRKVIEVFHYALRHNGFLMLGRSETTASHADLFALTDKKFKIYRKRPATVMTELTFRSRAPAEPLVEPVKPADASKPVRRRPDSDVQLEANRLVLDRYAPPGVIVDGALRVVRTQGKTSPYLELPSGDASLDLLKMARPGLLYGLRSAISEARNRGMPVRKEGIRVQMNGTTRAVNLDVTPLGVHDDRHFLVLFEADGVRPPRAKAAATPPARHKGKASKVSKATASHDRIVQHLEAELEANRQYLQSIIHDHEAANEELQSANEEILSSNEELQSTNEELDTAKEELQSTNEELSTLNDELQGRNEELSRVNSDLLNLLVSVNIPIVIVSTDLKIRRFTPAAERSLNLIAADIGRPIGHIKPNIECPELESSITEVIDSVAIKEQEVRDHDGGVYTLRIRPYKNVENRIDGAVLTLFDISTTRTYETELQEARDIIDGVLGVVKEPVLVLTRDLQVQRSNRAFRDRFSLGNAQIDGRPLREVGEGRWGDAALETRLRAVIGERASLDNFIIEYDTAQNIRRKLVVDARRVDSGLPRGHLIVLVIRDVADRAD